MLVLDNFLLHIEMSFMFRHLVLFRHLCTPYIKHSVWKLNLFSIFPFPPPETKPCRTDSLLKSTNIVTTSDLTALDQSQ